jgi:hypothetical protein
MLRGGGRGLAGVASAQARWRAAPGPARWGRRPLVLVGTAVTAAVAGGAAWWWYYGRARLGGDAEPLMRAGMRAAARRDWGRANPAFEKALAVRARVYVCVCV